MKENDLLTISKHLSLYIKIFIIILKIRFSNVSYAIINFKENKYLAFKIVTK